MKTLKVLILSVIPTFCWAGQHVQQYDPYINIGSATVTFGVMAGSMTDSEIDNGNCVQTGPGGHLTGTGSACVAPGQNLLVGTNTWSGTELWSSPGQSTFTFGVTMGSATVSNLTNGLCVQAGVGGLLTSAAAACGSGGGGSTPAPPIWGVQFDSNGVLGAAANLSWDTTNQVLVIGGGTSDPFSFLTINGGASLYGYSFTGTGYAVRDSTNTNIAVSPWLIQNLNDQFNTILGANRTGATITTRPQAGPDSNFIPMKFVAEDQASQANSVNEVLASTGLNVYSGVAATNTQMIYVSTAGAGTIPSTMTMLAASLTGTGNAIITEGNGTSGQVVITTQPPSAFQCGMWTSSITQVGITCLTGGGTPASPVYSIQYNNPLGTFAGSNNWQISGTSITLISSVTITDTQSKTNITPGYLDIFNNTAYVGKPLLKVGSINQSGQFIVQDQGPAQMATYGSLSGRLAVGNASHLEQIYDNNIGTPQMIDLGTTNQKMLLQTASGGPDGSISLSPNQVNEIKVSSWTGVVISTYVSILTPATGGYEFISSTSSFYHVQISTQGHFLSGGSTPTVSGCGTTPNGSVVGNDHNGVITIGGGSVTGCTLTFANSYGPNCIVACTISDSITTTTPDVVSTPTTMTLGFSASIGGGTVIYNCVGVTVGCL